MVGRDGTGCSGRVRGCDVRCLTGRRLRSRGCQREADRLVDIVDPLMKT